MKILIQTVAGDMHAAAVAAVLREAGVEVIFSVGTDVPSRHANSFYVDDRLQETTISRAGTAALNGDAVDLVWCRRVKLFQLPNLHPDDADLADREFRLFLTGFWQVAAKAAIRLNPPQARKLANSKLAPLIAARKAGLSISPTLASHDPDKVCEFAAARHWQCHIQNF